MKAFPAKSALTAAFVAASLLFAGTSAARDYLMVAGNGGGFQDNARKHLFQGYAKASGKAVKDDVFNGEMAKIYSMVRSGDVTYDVVMVEGPELVRGCEDGVFEKIDWTIVRKDKFIPNGTSPCGAGAVLSGLTLFYDASRVKKGPSNYKELWDVKAFPGKRAFKSGAKITMEMALLADGVPADQVYKVLATPAGQKRAFDKLDQIKPHVVWWKSGTQPVQLVGSGEVAYAIGWTGRTARANETGSNFPLQWNTLLWMVDYWAVVKGSPNTKDGMRMIEWMTNAQPLLALAADWPVSPANAQAASNPDLAKKNPAMLAAHASKGMFIDADFWVTHGEDLEAKFNTWVAR